MKCDGCGEVITSGRMVPSTGGVFCAGECFEAAQVEDALESGPDIIDSQGDMISSVALRESALEFMAARARREVLR